MLNRIIAQMPFGYEREETQLAAQDQQATKAEPWSPPLRLGRIGLHGGIIAGSEENGIGGYSSAGTSACPVRWRRLSAVSQATAGSPSRCSRRPRVLGLGGSYDSFYPVQSVSLGSDVSPTTSWASTRLPGGCLYYASPFISEPIAPNIPKIAKVI